MKTRTLLLLSVATGLMIILAGGVLLFQLSGQQESTPASPLGADIQVGDAKIIVEGANLEGPLLRVDVEVSGVADVDGIDAFVLVTGDQRLEPVAAAAPGRCAEITVEAQRCTVDFDVSASQGSSRVLVVRRGEVQATWRLA